MKPTPYNKRICLINFTGEVYHWGCHGTSNEIRATMIERGHLVETVSVLKTHSLSPTPQSHADFDNIAFFKVFRACNDDICDAISRSDVVLVNGEGTLHGVTKGSVNLLYRIAARNKFFGKYVSLINFSCFPNDDLSPPGGKTTLYPAVFQHVDKITVRETGTARILEKAGIKVDVGFDCLPRFINRIGFANTHEPEGHVLFSGGVNFTDRHFDFCTNLIKKLSGKNIQVRFLYGAESKPAPEDLRLKTRLENAFDDGCIEIIEATSMKEWLREFQAASFFFSARFHQTHAALSVGTPIRYMESKTPQTTCILETLGEKKARVAPDGDGIDALLDSIESAIQTASSNKSEQRLSKMLSLAENNFTKL